MPVPSLVLFDLDETLVDHGHASRTALTELRTRHEGLARMSQDEIEVRARQILTDVHDKVLSGTMTPAQARLERLRSLFDGCGLSPSDDFLDQTASEYGQIYRKAQRPSPGAIELLQKLGGHPEVVHVAILTNHLRHVQIAKLEDCGLTDLVDFMVTSEEVGHRKPSGEIFQSALGRAGVPASEAVMVGDSWEGDIQGARAAGLRAVWFNARAEPTPEDSLKGATVPELRSFEPLELACRVILSA